MARLWTYSNFSDVLTFPVTTPNNLAGGPVTLMAIVRRINTAAHYNPIVIPYSSAPAWRGPGMIILPTSDKLEFSTDGNINIADSTSITVTQTDGWTFVAVTKAAGTVTPRFHKYSYTTGTWTHENGTGNVADGTAPTTSGTWRLGLWSGIDFFDGEMEAVAVIPSVLSDQQVEALAFTWDAALAAAPVLALRLDQTAVTQPVIDWAGNSNQSARTGTTVSTSSVPFNLGDGIWTPTLPVGTAPAVSSTMSVSSKASAAITAHKAAASTVTATVRGSLAFSGRRQSNSTVTVGARVSAAFTGQKATTSTLSTSARSSATITGNRSVSTTLTATFHATTAIAARKYASGEFAATGHTTVNVAAGPKGIRTQTTVTARVAAVAAATKGAKSTLTVTNRGVVLFVAGRHVTSLTAVLARGIVTIAGHTGSPEITVLAVRPAGETTRARLGSATAPRSQSHSPAVGSARGTGVTP